MAEGYINKDMYTVSVKMSFNANGESSGWLNELGIAPNRNYVALAAYPTEWGPTTMTFDKHGFLELKCPTFANQEIWFIFVVYKALTIV